MTIKIEDVYEFLLPALAEEEIEDTPEHRLWALEGLYDGWKEDQDTSIEKTFWMLAVHTEIMRLQLSLMFPRIMSESETS